MNPSRLIAPLMLVLAVAILTALWHWTPLGRALEVDNLLHWGRGVSQGLWGPPLTLAAFVVGSLTAFPVTVLILVTGLLYGPGWGIVYAQCGIALGATVSFQLGRCLGRGRLDGLMGPRLERIAHRLARRGLLTVMVIRNLPVGSFTLVNLALGTSPITFRDYLLGTLLGMLPVSLLLILFGDSLARLMVEPGPESLLWVGGFVLLGGSGLLLLRHWSREVD